MNENSIIKASIFVIDRLRMGTNGHGVTTLVCFIGCPLNCAYFLNDRCHDDVFELDGVTRLVATSWCLPCKSYTTR